MKKSRSSVAAAAFFGTSGLLLGALWTLHGPIAWRAALLYMALPAISATLTGFVWGGAVLDPARTKNAGAAMLRGLLVALAAFVVFAALYSSALPLLERGWSWRSTPGLFVMTLMLGGLATGPLLALFGMAAGIALFCLRRWLAPAAAKRVSAGS